MGQLNAYWGFDGKVISDSNARSIRLVVFSNSQYQTMSMSESTVHFHHFYHYLIEGNRWKIFQGTIFDSTREWLSFKNIILIFVCMMECKKSLKCSRIISDEHIDNRDPFYWYELPFTPARIRNYIHYKVGWNYLTLKARFVGPTWGPPGSCRPRVGPCWPHEPCYLGNHSQNSAVQSLKSFHLTINCACNYFSMLDLKLTHVIKAPWALIQYKDVVLPV